MIRSRARLPERRRVTIIREASAREAAAFTLTASSLLNSIPLLNVVIHIIVGVGIADSFGKSAAFGLGLVFLPLVFYPVLGLGEAVYRAGRW